MSKLTFLQNIDPTTYYSIDVEFNNIEKYFYYLDNKNKWDKQSAKININKLYEFKKLAIEKNNTKYSDKIEISYVFDIYKCTNISSRLGKADYIYITESNEVSSKLNLTKVIDEFSINMNKTWIVGTKNFGKNNGSIYNNRNESDYCDQKTEMREGYLEENSKMKNKWKGRYINLIGLVIDKNGKVPVFTPDCKFISQDCAHFTHAGAVYYAHLIENIIKIE